MKLKSLLGNIDNAPTTKTASQAVAKTSGVSSAIDEALAQAEAVKTAAEKRNPAADLEKMASEVAEGLRDGEVGHVEKLGAAMADSFVRQLAAYEAAAEKIAMEKAAELNVTADEIAMVREARDNPGAFVQKVAAYAGQEPQLTEAEAEQVYEKTAQETVRVIHKTAMDHYAAGYATISSALEG